MTRTAIRHTVSALAGIVLISVFTSPAASAQGGTGRDDGWAIGMRIVDQQKTTKKPHSSMPKPRPSTGLTSPVGFNQGLFP